uniref:NAD-dependent epimerase/dehydratase family protein n=1 Tax=Thermofilum pendens TaxID=2269 RepID=A0A7C1P4Q3_THEPE
MVVLVTGGSGYVGSLLIRRLPFEKGFEGEVIRVLDNMSGDKYFSLFDLPEGVDYEFVLGDLTKAEDLKKALVDVDLVFDLAGITSVPLSFKISEETKRVNVEGARNLLEVALSSGVRKVVYASSAAVYGDVNGLVDESHPCNPTSPYAESKLLAEKLYLEAHRERGLGVAVLRFGTIYGFAPGARFDTVVNRFAFLAAIGSPLTVWRGAETALRPYLYVGDAVNALLLAARRNETSGGVFNVVTENATLSDVISAVREAVPDCVVQYVEPPYQQQISYGLIDSKIRSLGYEPRGSLNLGVKEIVGKFRAFLHRRKKEGAMPSE